MRLIKYYEFLNGIMLGDRPDNYPRLVRNINYVDNYSDDGVASITLSQIFSEMNNLKNNLGFEKEDNKISFNLLNNDVEVFRNLDKNKFRYFLKINGEFVNEDESQIERLFNILFFL